MNSSSEIGTPSTSQVAVSTASYLGALMSFLKRVPFQNAKRLSTRISHITFNKREKKKIQSLLEHLTIDPNIIDNGEVLVDIADTFAECIEQLAFARYFRDRFDLKPCHYLSGFTPRRQICFQLFGRAFPFVFHRGYRLGKNLGIGPGLDGTIINQEISERASSDTDRFLAAIATKRDVLDYAVDQVKIGIAIYDTLLCETGSFTVDIESRHFRDVAKRAFLTLRCAQRYFIEHKVRAVVLGHSVYLNWHILSDVACSQGCPVFVTYNSGVPPIHCVNSNRRLQTTNHLEYKASFFKLEPKERDKARNRGLDLIRRRIEGERDRGISYMSASPYSTGLCEGLDVNIDREKKIVLMMLHAFSDNPHVYSWMVFDDFLEWLLVTVDAFASEPLRSQYQLLVKPHPNSSVAEQTKLNALLNRYPSVVLVSANTSNRFLFSLAPCCILTVYGSCAAEFAYLGVPVITCGDNPTSAFGFTYEATNRMDYISLLHRVGSLKCTFEMRCSVGEFAYMHYINGIPPFIHCYPFERFTPDDARCGVERVNDFSFETFASIVDARFEATEFDKVTAQMNISATPLRNA